MDLNVTQLPLRKGVWLALQEGGKVRPIAKFRNDSAVQDFLAWAESNSGKTMLFNGGDK